MKRIILLAALLLAASACAKTTEAPNNTPAQPTNVNTSATPKASTTVTEADITAREKEIWDKIKQKDLDGFAAMLADDFVSVSGAGVHDKEATVGEVKNLELTDFTFSDWKVVMLDKDAAVVTYTVTSKGTAGGKPLPTTPWRGSSAWVNRGGKWLGVFHQETEAKEAPSSSDKSAKPAASTETKSAAAVTPEADPIAREKQVWDAVKKRDYDTFESFLAEDLIEVFEWGVNDRAASLEGVRNVDLSKASLSDFKTVKLNNGATLVVYTVRGPSPPFSKDGERDSSIWANRNGKWLAVFHQATPIVSATAGK